MWYRCRAFRSTYIVGYRAPRAAAWRTQVVRTLLQTVIVDEDAPDDAALYAQHVVPAADYIEVDLAPNQNGR